MSDSPLNLFGRRRRRKRRKAKLAAMSPEERASYQANRQAKLQQIMSGGGLFGVGQGGVGGSGAGVGGGGGDVQSQISEINAKLDALTGNGGGAGGATGIANTVSNAATEITGPEPADAMGDDLGSDLSAVDGDSALAKLRKYKGKCKMKRKNN